MAGAGTDRTTRRERFTCWCLLTGMLLVSVVQVRGMHRDGSDVGGIVIVVVAAAVIAVAAFRLWRTRAG